MRFRRFGFVPLAAALVVLAAPSAGCQAPRDTIDVLFVGNSYIYFNDLPAMVEGISSALEGPILHGAAHTHGGFTLRGHLDDGHLSGILSGGPTDGGPSYLAACVIYATLTGRSRLGAPRELTGPPWDYAGLVESTSPTILVSLSAADAEFLQRTAWEVVQAGG